MQTLETEITATGIDPWEGTVAISMGQILDGNPACEHCGGEAKALIATGADLDYEPVCWQAARQLMMAAVGMFDAVWGAKPL